MKQGNNKIVPMPYEGPSSALIICVAKCQMCLKSHRKLEKAILIHLFENWIANVRVISTFLPKWDSVLTTQAGAILIESRTYVFSFY